MDTIDHKADDILFLTAEIVRAYVGNNATSISDVPGLISSVHASLATLDDPVVPPAPELTPAVSIRASVRPDHIVCLEDGKKLTMLKRYLRTNFGMSPEEYRAKWGLPADYPMVAPNYAEKRRQLALSIGLGKSGAAKA